MANNITRWNPFRELATMQNVMDRFWENNWRPFFEEGQVGANTLALDVHENDTNYTISTELPGVKPDNIQVRVENDMLMIDATIEESTEREAQGNRPLIKERRYGHYSRRLRLPQHVNFEQADASYEDGVLTLTLPKAPEAQPKLIQVRAGHQTNGGNGSSRK